MGTDVEMSLAEWHVGPDWQIEASDAHWERRQRPKKKGPSEKSIQKHPGDSSNHPLLRGGLGLSGASSDLPEVVVPEAAFD